MELRPGRHRVPRVGHALLLATLVTASCAAPRPIHRVRFLNRAPVVAVNDRINVPHEPEENPYYQFYYQYENFFQNRMHRLLTLHESHRARGVNSLDDVPDSTWFTNRDIESLSPDDIRRGPNVSPDPQRNLPWTIVSSKLEGAAPGLVIADSKGQKYLLKFDMRDFPETETASHMIVHRIMWALGYNVPQDWLVHVDPTQLRITEKSVRIELDGSEKPLTPGDVKAVLDRAASDLDGRYRAIASQFVPGKPLGGAPMSGTREGDPNDIIPHEQRRDLRGMFPIFAWVKNTDMKESNTLDTWTEDPDHPGKKIVLHYLIDFGKCLGILGLVGHDRDEGFRYVVDADGSLRSLVSLGMWISPWDPVEPTGMRGVGLFDVEHYDPGQWNPRYPYLPFTDADRFDGYWGSKLLIRLSREQLAAAVDMAHYSDPHARSYVLRTLVARQRKTARFWFRLVNPVDHFQLSPARLCFDDLALAYHLESGPRRYHLRTYDYDGRHLGTTTAEANADGHVCATIPQSPSRNSYGIVRIDTQAPGLDVPAVEVHIARGGSHHRLRVIGVRRH